MAEYCEKKAESIITECKISRAKSDRYDYFFLVVRGKTNGFYSCAKCVIKWVWTRMMFRYFLIFHLSHSCYYTYVLLLFSKDANGITDAMIVHEIQQSSELSLSESCFFLFIFFWNVRDASRSKFSRSVVAQYQSIRLNRKTHFIENLFID